MISYDDPDPDPIVAEVRRAREEIFAEYDFDLRKMMEAMMKRQREHPELYASSSSSRPIETEVPKKVG
jgi:hypothetical protein